METKPHRVSNATITIRVVLCKEWEPPGTSEQLLIRSKLSIWRPEAEGLLAGRQGRRLWQETDSGKNGKGSGTDHIPKEGWEGSGNSQVGKHRKRGYPS